jgi:hypothetical protein
MPRQPKPPAETAPPETDTPEEGLRQQKNHLVRGRRQPDMKLSIAARQEMYARFREHTEEVLERLLTVIRSDTASDADAIAAGKEILNRGWGTVPQHHVVEQVFTHQTVINVGELRSMSPAQLASLESMLARLVEMPESQVIEGQAKHLPD